MIWSLVFMALAAACNAVMDTCAHHYSTSIFPRFQNIRWWDARISWLNKYEKLDQRNGRVKWFWKINKPVQLTDAWHLFKFFMILFLCLAIVSYTWAGPSFGWFPDIMILGVTWNAIFLAFYKKLLLSKFWQRLTGFC